MREFCRPAVERYVASREHKDDARRAARVCETAVGEALGETRQGERADLQLSQVGESSISKDDRHRFRLMAAHRDLWWPALLRAT